MGEFGRELSEGCALTRMAKRDEGPALTGLVERVAKAVANVMDNYPAVDASPSRIREIRAEWIARAAIEAMREPTKRMVEAVEDHYSGLGSSTVEYVWDGMIGAALRERQ